MKKLYSGKVVPGVMDTATVKHLSHAYGTLAEQVAAIAQLAFLDTDAAGRALPRIIQILVAEHNWDKSRQKQEVQKATEFLKTFKSSKNAQFDDRKHN
ncbi:hypothetical protein LOK49_LG13G00075 [Camellia lanceoleosa]|uniref:Uncharacterized protein n=1 Tax=Camellia lanceoleosa TaxID=1840588 RepID=A0ACC0FG01_9ERIC|nr:hypothetical protein LOK49_LG13G00075 [Camellia lanceoleosa]